MEWLSIVLALIAFAVVLVSKSQVDALVHRVAGLELEVHRLKNALNAAMARAPVREQSAAAVGAQDHSAQPAAGGWRRCPQCARLNEVVATFCSECGSPLREEVALRAAGSPVAAPQAASARPTKVAAAAVAADDEELKEWPPLQPMPAPTLPPLLQKVKGTEEWEALIGGRWMNRVGAVALILGLAFFFKYAIDQNWISQSLRVVIGLVVGAGLLVLAWRSHLKELVIFAQGLVGAGIAILYLSVYASFQFYHLVPEPVALTAMGCVTALALAQALYYNSLAVALLAWIGGFVTIPLLGISHGTEMGLIGYLLLLNAAMLAIVFAKDDWFILEPLSMAGTYLTYFAWYFHSYTSSKLVLAAVSVTLLWALFYALDVSRIVTRLATHGDLHHGLGAVNALAYYGAMLALLHDHRVSLGFVTLGIGAAYIGTILMTKRGLQSADRLDARYTLTAIALAIVATPILLSGFPVVIVWSLEALALLWCGVHWKLWYIWRPAPGVFALASAFLLFTPGALAYSPLHDFRPILNERFLTFAVLAAALAAGTLVLRGLEVRNRASLTAALHYGWCVAVFVLLTVETNDYFRQALVGASHLTTLHLELTRWLVLAVVWMGYSLPLIWYGRHAATTPWGQAPPWGQARTKPLRSPIFAVLSSGLAVVALSVGLGMAAGASYQPIEQFTLLLNVRAVVLILLIAGLAVQYRLLRRERETYPWMGGLIAGYQIAAGLLGFELLTAEIHDFFRQQSGTLAEHAGGSGLFVELMALAAIWMLYSFPLVRYGIRNRAMTFLLLGLGCVGVSVGAGAIAALSFEPTHWLSLALSMRPVVLLFLTVGLFVHIHWARESRAELRWLDVVLLALQACTVLLWFELITAQTRDVFEYHIATARGISADVDRWRNLEQLTLSIVWLVYAIALMGIGFWRRTRWLRLGAMALLGFIILKIFVYDLSFLSSAYRSISFAGLGVILIGVSFLYQRYKGLLLDPT